MVSIPLRSSDKQAFIDDDDFEKVSKYKWSITSDGYARTTNDPRTSMHRIVMDAKKGQAVDHINRNRLDNRRENLRFATTRENAYNKSAAHYNKTGLKGVRLERKTGKYVSAITVEGKTLYLGSFETALEAHQAYIQASLKHHGEFSYFRNGQNVLEDVKKLSDNIWDKDGKFLYWANAKYSNYLLIQRSLLQSMPLEWQEKLIELLKDMERHFGRKSNGQFVVLRMGKERKYVPDPLADYDNGARIITPEDLDVEIP